MIICQQENYLIEKILNFVHQLFLDPLGSRVSDRGQKILANFELEDFMSSYHCCFQDSFSVFHTELKVADFGTNNSLFVPK